MCAIKITQKRVINSVKSKIRLIVYEIAYQLLRVILWTLQMTITMLCSRFPFTAVSKSLSTSIMDNKTRERGSRGTFPFSLLVHFVKIGGLFKWHLVDFTRREG